MNNCENCGHPNGFHRESEQLVKTDEGMIATYVGECQVDGCGCNYDYIKQI